MNGNQRYLCPECDKPYAEDDSRLGGELFCPVCKSRLEQENHESPNLTSPHLEPSSSTYRRESKNISVEVKDINMSFMSMVVFMVKWAIASIPAMIILMIIAWVVSVILGGFF